MAAALLEQPEAIAGAVGRPVNLKKVLVRDPARQRDVALPDGVITANPEDILADPDIPWWWRSSAAKTRRPNTWPTPCKPASTWLPQTRK